MKKEKMCKKLAAAYPQPSMQTNINPSIHLSVDALILQHEITMQRYKNTYKYEFKHLNFICSQFL